MKQVIALILILAGLSFSQFDDRKTGLVVNGTVSVTSNTFEIPLFYDYDWCYLTVTDTGATYDDSLIVEVGAIDLVRDATRPNLTYIGEDTVWQRPSFMRDSSWTNTNLVVDDASVHSYSIYIAPYEVMRIRMTNVQAVTNRKAFFKAHLSKKVK